jgi:hypothetical protein
LPDCSFGRLYPHTLRQVDGKFTQHICYNLCSPRCHLLSRPDLCQARYSIGT